MKGSTDRSVEALREARRAGMPYEDEMTLEELASLQSELMQREKSWGAIYEAITWAYYIGYQRGAARKEGAAGKVGE